MRKRLFFIWLALFAVASAQAQDWKVLFSANGGFYEDVFDLELFSTHPQGHIRYTINGNRPTAQSQRYTEPLTLDERLYSKSDIYTIFNCPETDFFLPDSVQHCIVIRAAVFDGNDSCISPVATQSYFIRALGCDTHGLPAVSLCADSLDLFDYERGILVPGATYDPLNPNHSGNYCMRGREWEREINVEFREPADNSGINQPCGLRTHGNRARKQPQKGLKIYAREEYGKKRFHHRFFENTPLDSFKHFIIKPYSTLWPNSGIQDYLCNQLAILVGLEAGHSRPVCLFLNGEYWGIYFLQEKLDERFLEDHFGIDIEQCTIISNWWELECGDMQGFLEMMDWLETADLTFQDDYDHISSLVDIDNFIDYMVFETFVANYDWPANNVRCWQRQGGKWRWMFFDGDAAFNAYGIDPYANPTELDVFGNATYIGDYTWPSSQRATLLFRRLLENDEFQARFDDRIHALSEGVLSYASTSAWYSRICAMIGPEIGRQSFRFGNPSSPGFWNWACTLTDDFLSDRVSSYYAEWTTFLGIEKPLSASIHCFPNPSSGEIHVRWRDNGDPPDEIAIYDFLGRKVFAQPVGDRGSEEFVIHPNLPAGIYVLRTGCHAQKIVIQ